MTLGAAYRAFRARVLLWARRFGAPEEDLDDVAQEVFQAFERNGADVPDAAVSTWLHTATRHRTRNFRKKLARRRAGEASVAREITAPVISQESAIGGREVEATILALLARLEPTRREVFVRHILGEEPLEDIAAAQGVSSNTARARLRYARRDLRKALERFRAEERRCSLGGTSFAFAPLLFCSRLWRYRTARIIVAMLCGAAVLPVLVLAVDDAPQLGPTAEEPIAGRAVEVVPLLPVAFVEAPHERGAVQGGDGESARARGAELAELAEVDLVTMARRALNDGSPARARGFLDRADHAYPAGAFLSERAQLRARAAP